MQKGNKVGTVFNSGSTGDGDNNYLTFIALLALGGVFIGLIIIGLSTLINQYFEPSQWLYLGFYLLFGLAFSKRHLAVQMEDKVMKLPFSFATLPIKLVPLFSGLVIIFLYFRMK